MTRDLRAAEVLGHGRWVRPPWLACDETTVCICLPIQGPFRHFRLIRSGVRGPPCHCAPLVCVPAVIGVLTACQHQTKNQMYLLKLFYLASKVQGLLPVHDSRTSVIFSKEVCLFTNPYVFSRALDLFLLPSAWRQGICHYSQCASVFPTFEYLVPQFECPNFPCSLSSSSFKPGAARWHPSKRKKTPPKRGPR